MIHTLAAVPNASSSIANVLLWVEKSIRVILILAIGFMFLWKGSGSFPKHLLEVLVLLILGVWYIGQLLPASVTTIVAKVNSTGAAGSTGESWGALAVLFGIATIVYFAYR